MQVADCFVILNIHAAVGCKLDCVNALQRTVYVDWDCLGMSKQVFCLDYKYFGFACSQLSASDQPVALE
jgi:hypothetical protein